jgi:hypothetical protein
MRLSEISHRMFLATAGPEAGVSALHPQSFYGVSASLLFQCDTPADYTLTVATKPMVHDTQKRLAHSTCERRCKTRPQNAA